MQGPCEGDSGGPLYVEHGEPGGRKRLTVEGIVAGGVACGKNIPVWYTRVRINCISSTSYVQLVISGFRLSRLDRLPDVGRQLRTEQVGSGEEVLLTQGEIPGQKYSIF